MDCLQLQEETHLVCTHMRTPDKKKIQHVLGELSAFFLQHESMAHRRRCSAVGVACGREVIKTTIQTDQRTREEVTAGGA